MCKLHHKTSYFCFHFTLQINGHPPSLVRVLFPNRKIPSDLKRSQILHNQLGVKICAVVEFPNRPDALKAINLSRSHWGKIYAYLLCKLIFHFKYSSLVCMMFTSFFNKNIVGQLTSTLLNLSIIESLNGTQYNFICSAFN